MKSRKLWILLVLLGVVCGVGAILFLPNLVAEEKVDHNKAITDFTKRDVLAGLQGVNVTVENFQPGAEKYGLTGQTYRTDVELRLRQYGIKVLSEDEWRQTLGQPYLYININTIVNEEISFAAYNTDIQLFETATLMRNRRLSMATICWQSGGTGYCSPSKLKEVVRDAVRDHVDKFINAYMAANPREGFRRSSSTTSDPQRGLVSGIVSSEEGFGAMIGIEFVREGDTIDGVTVVKINADRVEFEKNGKRWTQGLNETPGPQWQ